MTREEAVARIKDHIEIHRYHERNAVKIFEALDMAIKALEQPEPCEDAISRQAAIDAVSRGCLEFRGIFAECEKNLNELPSVQPDTARRIVGKSRNGMTERRWNPCDWCVYNPPSSMDGKPCTLCPAVANPE